MEAVVYVMIAKEKEAIVKNRIARIKLECTFADFFKQFAGLNKLENEVSGYLKIEIRETIEGTIFQISCAPHKSLNQSFLLLY